MVSGYGFNEPSNVSMQHTHMTWGLTPWCQRKPMGLHRHRDVKENPWICEGKNCELRKVEAVFIVFAAQSLQRFHILSTFEKLLK